MDGFPALAPSLQLFFYYNINACASLSLCLRITVQACERAHIFSAGSLHAHTNLYTRRIQNWRAADLLYRRARSMKGSWVHFVTVAATCARSHRTAARTRKRHSFSVFPPWAQKRPRESLRPLSAPRASSFLPLIDLQKSARPTDQRVMRIACTPAKCFSINQTATFLSREKGTSSQYQPTQRLRAFVVLWWQNQQDVNYKCK